MGVEIERKFLLKNDGWKNAVAESFDIVQGYLSRDPDRTLRVRRRGDQAFLTIKGRAGKVENGQAPVTPEFEYAIPPADADKLLALCLAGAIAKTRHIVLHEGHKWEIDVFHAENDGLVVAEIELQAPDEHFVAPGWLGADVTMDKRYSNSALSENPFKNW